MNIPEGILELTVVGVVGFIFKVVFGLIQKNEVKSDEADRRIEGEIKEIRTEVKDVEERQRSNEHKLFDKVGDQAERISYLEAKQDS